MSAIFPIPATTLRAIRENQARLARRREEALSEAGVTPEMWDALELKPGIARAGLFAALTEQARLARLEDAALAEFRATGHPLTLERLQELNRASLVWTYRPLWRRLLRR